MGQALAALAKRQRHQHFVLFAHSPAARSPALPPSVVYFPRWPQVTIGLPPLVIQFPFDGGHCHRYRHDSDRRGLTAGIMGTELNLRMLGSLHPPARLLAIELDRTEPTLRGSPCVMVCPNSPLVRRKQASEAARSDSSTKLVHNSVEKARQHPLTS